MLWLDDKRNPEHGWIKPDDLKYDIVWVKSYDEFTQWILSHGLPDRISFDHDLDDEHYVAYGYIDLDPALPESHQIGIDYDSFKEKTGYDCAKWLVAHCEQVGGMLPLCTVHSANYEGAQNIRQYLLNASKHLNI